LPKNEPVDRAEFAAMIQKLLTKTNLQLNAGWFTDVPGDYWALLLRLSAGFMTGFPGGLFLPNQPIRYRRSLL